MSHCNPHDLDFVFINLTTCFETVLKQDKISNIFLAFLLHIRGCIDTKKIKETNYNDVFKN